MARSLLSKSNSARGKITAAMMLGGVKDGIELNDHIERHRGTIVEHACKLGHDGHRRKTRDSLLRKWKIEALVEVKNPTVQLRKGLKTAHSDLRNSQIAWETW